MKRLIVSKDFFRPETVDHEELTKPKLTVYLDPKKVEKFYSKVEFFEKETIPSPTLGKF